MNDEDISKLAAKLTESLATKDDILELKKEFKADIARLEQKTDTILQFADNIDESVNSLDKRVTNLENNLETSASSNS